uniref:Uncharacterized protein n=1 Tax=Graphocephala atropunctata TaxID=36148 RepID=A0A1B6KSD8_9HEMI
MMAEFEQTDVLKVGSYLGGESHPSQKSLHVDSGDGKILHLSPLGNVSAVLAEDSEIMDLVEADVFQRCHLTHRSPVSSETSTLPTEIELDNIHDAVGAGDLLLGMILDESRETSEAEAQPDNLSIDLDLSRLVVPDAVPSKYRKLLQREKKESEGTWIPWKE